MGQHSVVPAADEPDPADDDPVDMQTTTDVVTSLIRVWVPIAVGAVVTWLASSRHIVIPADASAAAGAFAATTCAAAYYAMARFLERARQRRVRTVGHWMLGGNVPPVYLESER